MELQQKRVLEVQEVHEQKLIEEKMALLNQSTSFSNDLNGLLLSLMVFNRTILITGTVKVPTDVGSGCQSVAIVRFAKISGQFTLKFVYTNDFTPLRQL